MLWPLLSYSAPLATLFVTSSYWTPFGKSALEIVTLASGCFFAGYVSKHCFGNRIKLPSVLIAIFSVLFLSGILPLIRAFDSSALAPKAVSATCLFIQGFLFQFNLTDTKLLLGSNLLTFALSLFVIQIPSFATKTKPNEMIVSERTELDQRFRFVEGSRLGALPIHRLYRGEVEQFNSETEQTHHLCLTSLTLQWDRVIRGGSKTVLIVGGADGLAARSALYFSSVKQLTILDSDSALFEHAKKESKFRIYNLDSLGNTKARFIGADPLTYLMWARDEQFDIVILDLVQTRLLTVEFFSALSRGLSEKGTIALSIPESQLGLIQQIASALHFAVAAVRPLKTEETLVLLTKTAESIDLTLDGLLKGPQRPPCRRIPIPTESRSTLPTLSSWITIK